MVAVAGLGGLTGKGTHIVILDLGKLGSKELKDLSVAVKEERDRRGKKNPAAHAPSTWSVPQTAIQKNKETTKNVVA
jgi:hypothetical protein